MSGKTKTKTKTKKINSLSKNYKSFVLEYIRNGRNGVKAYMKVYPRSSYNAAGVSAFDLLKKPKIKEALEEYYQELWENKEKEIGKTFDNLLKIANADINNVIDYKDGEMKIRNFDEIDSSIIQQINQTITNTKEGQKINESIKLFDKTKAISELLKVLEMVKDKMENPITIEIIPPEWPDEKR